MSDRPEPIERLVAAFKRELAATEVDVEARDPGSRFLVTVFSPRFTGMTHLARQDLVWDVVDRVCTRDESELISLILAYAPGEIEAFVNELGK